MAPHQDVALEQKKGQKKKKVDHAPSKPFPHMYQFLVQKCENNVGLVGGVRNLFEESDVVMIEMSGIRDADPKERIENFIEGIEKIPIPTCEDPISPIVRSTYPDYFIHSTDTSYFQKRAILAPTLDMVESINDYMISFNQNTEKTYLSSDTGLSDHSFSALDNVPTPEILNNIKCSGIPNHSITLKIGIPMMLLRNIDQSSGLWNGTRLIITRHGNRVIKAKVLSGNMEGKKVVIPRMTLIASDARIPFKFQRRQFPLIVSVAMSINKSQGQSLSYVGLFLKKSVFTHGQLYIALSRVTSRKGSKIFTYDDDGNICNEVTNVVYKEVFRNLI
ncbi:uncharacterized protein LOC129892818 [Solanum dulcamara]|uniref:uncharacterized protein LOC129892818 n=1 Tax=Solanum dulcamara TaxID=45834 RepID=UPI0024858E15|nr:uncharacterized protein LOC129892818 [Solanum dulcamara]